MVLTQIFKAYTVPIHEDEPKRALRHTNIYNLATLKRLGFQKINDVWTRKSEQSEGIEISEDPRCIEEEILRASSPISPPPPQTE